MEPGFRCWVLVGGALLMATAAVIGPAGPARAQPAPIVSVQIPHFAASVALSFDGARLFAAMDFDYNDHRILRIDTASALVTATASTPGSGAITLSPDGSRLYQLGSGSVVVLDAGTLAVLGQIAVRASALALSPDGSRLYLTTGSTGHLTVVDAASWAVLADAQIARETHALAIDPSGTRAYVMVTGALSGGGDGLAAVDTTSLAITAVGMPTEHSDCVLVNPTGSRVYVNSQTPLGVRTLVSVDPATLAQVATVDLGNRAGCPAVSRDGARLYVVIPDDMSGRKEGSPLSYIDAATMTRAGQVPFASAPSPFALLSDGSHGWFNLGTSMQLIDLSAAMEPAPALAFTGTIAQLAALPGVAAMDKAMQGMLARDVDASYRETGPDGEAYYPVWTFTRAKGTARWGSSDEVTYMDGKQVCNRRATRKLPNAIASDRSAHWKCRHRTAADEDLAMPAMRYSPSVFPTTQLLVKEPSVQGSTAPLQAADPRRIAYGLFIPSVIGARPDVLATYARSPKRYTLEWGADTGLNFLAGRMIISRSKVLALPKLSTLRK